MYVYSISDEINSNICLDFTNFVQLTDVKKLAEADEYECVRVVQECYVDYLPINAHLYSLDIPISAEVLVDDLLRLTRDFYFVRNTINGMRKVFIEQFKDLFPYYFLYEKKLPLFVIKNHRE